MTNSYSFVNPDSPTRPRNSCALAVMIKVPKAGASKTRLVPPLAPEEAAQLSVCFLRDTTANIAGVAAHKDAEGVAVYTPAGAEATFRGMLPSDFSLLAQRGESFGDRLLHATEDLLAAGYRSVCLIDSDSPTLPPALLAQAVDALSRPGDRVVLGAADDGGYYLIGLKNVHRRLFAEVDWSTEKVLQQTCERASEIGLEVEVLPAWYDVDHGETLARLCEELFVSNGRGHSSESAVRYEAPHTTKYLARLLRATGQQRIGRDEILERDTALAQKLDAMLGHSQYRER